MSTIPHPVQPFSSDLFELPIHFLVTLLNDNNQTGKFGNSSSPSCSSSSSLLPLTFLLTVDKHLKPTKRTPSNVFKAMLLTTILLALVFVASLINILLYVPPKKLHLHAWTWIKLFLFTPKSPTASSAADTNDSPETQKLPSTKKMSTEKKVELERVFATFDKNGDGFITRQELRESLRGIRIFISDAEVDDLVNGSDANGDGHIDFDEFCELLESVSAAASTGCEEEEETEPGRRVSEDRGGRDGELKEAFDVFDKDRDGLITVEELGHVLSCLGMSEGKRVEACKEMIRKVDVDGDGMVNFDEFKRMMRGGHSLVSAY